MKYLHSNILNKMMLFLILLFFLMMSVSITHAEIYSSFKTWGAEGVGTGEFGHPYAVDVDSSGNVYVADTDNNRIQKFDSIGTYITQWSSSLNSPRGIATDSSGNVYVADTNNNRIQKFSSSGTYLTEWVYSFNIPQGIATDSSGNVYVADRNNHVIKKFNSNGGYLATFGASGSGNGQFLYPEDVAVDSSGNIYVAEYGNNRIQKLDSSGNYLAQWGSEGGGNSQFQLPGGITVDSSGYVYVADTDNNRIQKFDSTGTYITQWSSAFASPKGIAVNSSGYVYVADTNNHRIQDFYIRYSYSIDKAVTDVAGRGSSGHAINASDVITYRITVNNTGDGNLTNMNVTDSLISSLPSPTGDNAPTGTLNVGETWVYNLTYTVAQDDLNNKSGGDGFINNTATVDCDQLDSLNDSEAVIADYNLSYSINKTVNSIIGGIAGNVTKAGDVVVYEINVTNDGNIDLTNVTLNDTLINLSEHIESNTSDGILDPEETWTYTGNYTVTQGDIDNNGGGDEYINNTATVDCGQLDLKNASTAAHIDQTPFWVNKTVLDVAGKGPLANVTKAGDVISYQINVTNYGGLPFQPVSIYDSLSTITGPTESKTSDKILNPGENWIYTANYTVIQNDLNNNGGGDGVINNTAIVYFYGGVNRSKENRLVGLESSNAEVQVEQNPSYAINKTVTNISGAIAGNVTKAGNVISYQVNLTNDGNLNLTNVTLTDSLINLSAPSESNVADRVLVPGENWTYTGNYTVNQTDINNNGNDVELTGYIINTANVTCDQLGPELANASVHIDQTPYWVNKTVIDVAGKGPFANATKAGDIITYQVNVTNYGGLPFKPVPIYDSLVALTGPNETKIDNRILDPDESWYFTGVYTVTQADLNSKVNRTGIIKNTATAYFYGGVLKSENLLVGSNSSSTEVPADYNPSYMINKTILDVAGNGSSANITKAGDNVTYQINVTNDGNIDLTNVSVNDSLINLTSPLESKAEDGILNPDESWTYNVTYTVNQSEINSNGDGDGFLNNTATVQADQMLDYPGYPKNASAAVQIEWNPVYNINKTVVNVSGNGSTANITKAGDVIDYQVYLTNDGNVDLTNVSVNDSLINLTAALESKTTDGILEVGENWTYNVNYTVSQAEININGGGDGFLNNTVTVNSTQIEPKSTSAAVQIEWNPVYNISKTVVNVSGNGSTANITKAGDKIDYQIYLTNDGNVDLTNVTVNESLINLTAALESKTSDGILEVGENWTYNVNYTVAQADININGGGDGFLNNTVTVNSTQLESKSASAAVHIEWNPVYNINKTVLDVAGNGSTANITKAGDVINYLIYLTNDGNVDLTNVSVNDSLVNLSSLAESKTADEILEVGENWTYNVNYTVYQAQINNNGEGDGFLNNTVNVDSDQLESKSSSAAVPIVQNPAYNINKTVLDIAGRGAVANVTAAGDLINYRIYLINEGNVDLTNVTVNDSLINLTAAAESKTSDGILEVGENWTYNVSYAVTQTDMNNNAGGDGFINNTVTVDSYQLEPNSSSAAVPLVQNLAYNISKTVLDIGGKGPAVNVTVAGDLITYLVNVTNDGNVDLINVSVNDSLINLTSAVESKTADSILNPGENWTYTGNYTITKADIGNQGEGDGFINNTATVICAQLGQKSDSADVSVENSPSYSVNDTAVNVSGEGPSANTTAAGDEFSCQFNLTNNGNVNLTNVTVTSSLFSFTGPVESLNPNEVLEPGENWTYTGNYTVSQEDINNNGTSGNGLINGNITINCTELDSQTFSVQLPIERVPSYSLFKSSIGADEKGDCIINRADDIIEYRIVVKNDGNVDLTNVSVSDPMINLAGPTGDDIDPGVLNLGELWVFTGNYTVTSSDINNESVNISNTATVVCDQLSEKNSSVEMPVDRKADLSIYKAIIGIDEAGDFMINNPGDVINYQIAVRNNGDIDLTGVSVNDPRIPILEGPTGYDVDSGVLKSGKTWVYTGNYTVTREDIDNEGDGSGFIENTASVSCDKLSNESSSTILPIIRVPPIVVTPETEGTKLLVADFSTSVTSGYAPLSVQFTDKSQNAATWSWDFNGDGAAESTVQNPPAYTYTTAGTFTANLTVSNANGSASKTATIIVLEETGSSDSSSSSGGSSGSSSSGGGGSSGGSAEPANNVEAKEISQVFIGSGSTVRFDFPKNATPVVYVSFGSKKTFGKTNTIVEMLKGKSTFVSALPSNEVYKHVNIWIGNSGVVTNNIENAVVCFKVEKSWIQDKKIDQSSITLNRYSDGKWEQLQTNQSGEDDKYLYFIAKTPGFSPFAITGKTTAAGTEVQPGTSTQKPEQNNGGTSANAAQKNNTSVPAKQSKKTPGFEIICGITALFAAVFLYSRK